MEKENVTTDTNALTTNNDKDQHTLSLLSSIKPHITFSSLGKKIITVSLLCLILLSGVYYIFLRENDSTEPETFSRKYQTILTKQKLLVGTSPTHPPMEFYDESKTLTGFDVDLAYYLAKEMGVAVEFVTDNIPTLLQKIDSGDVDIVLSSIEPSKKMQNEYELSNAYITVGKVLVVTKENTSITSVNDISAKRIGVLDGSVDEIEALKYTTLGNVKKYESEMDLSKALLAHEIDVMFADVLYAQEIIKQEPKFSIVGDPFNELTFVVVMSKGDNRFTIDINKLLNSIRQKGILITLTQKWME